MLVAVLGLAACGPEAVPASVGRTPAGVLSEADALAVAKRITLPVDALAPLGLTGAPEVDQPVAVLIPGCGIEASHSELPQAAHIRAWDTDKNVWAVGDYGAVSTGAVQTNVKAANLLQRVESKARDCGVRDGLEMLDAGTGAVAYCVNGPNLRGDGESTECVLYVAQDLPGYTLVAAFGYQHVEAARAKAGLLLMAPRVRDQLARA
ncbi:hypothetical protein AB0M43_12970 [Longispora sp. NPDC051575]|uniref:hypothetical protein n=1 Tax=Longispora sp. NPDC051575 TaxID=3154943 RepID=UPI00342D88FE